jgi:hypothetical protein
MSSSRKAYLRYRLRVIEAGAGTLPPLDGDPRGAARPSSPLAEGIDVCGQSELLTGSPGDLKKIHRHAVICW